VRAPHFCAPKLQPAQISQMYAKALATGRRDGKGGLSPASVLYIHRILKEALAVAASEWRLLPESGRID